MDRSRTALRRLADRANDNFVPGTMAERIAMVWPLTVEASSLSKQHDPGRPLERHRTRLFRRKLRAGTPLVDDLTPTEKLSER